MLAVQLRWVAGMEIFIVSCKVSAFLCQILKFPAVPPVLVSDLAVPSTQGHLHLPYWLGRKRPVPQYAMVVHGRSPCTRTRGLASPTPAPCVAAGGVWSSSAEPCYLFRMGKRLGSPNWSEVQLSPFLLPP